jgi:hypothetical protein
MTLPNEYWREGRERQGQYLYVGFCEFASGVLDYCEGAELLHDSTSRSTRRNWAATILYYSLVHTARFIIFATTGDFPKGHAGLIRCFERGKRAETNWLQGLIAGPDGELFAARAPFPEDDGGRRRAPISTTVGFSELSEHWSRLVPHKEIDEGFVVHPCRTGQRS